jgi:hypothetical protein
MTRDEQISMPAPAEAKVLPLHSAPPQDALALALAAEGGQPRETSWRDLVRRLAKNPARR